MKIDIKATGIDLTEAIRGHVEDKIEGLSKYVHTGEENIHADVEVQKTTAHHHKGEGLFRAEINLHLSGHLVRGEATEADLYVAVDKSVQIVVDELNKAKDKRIDLRHKGAREVKEILQEGVDKEENDEYK